MHDKGTLEIKGEIYKVENVEKVGKCILHFLNREIKEDVLIGDEVKGVIDMKRRNILRNHHSGTHIVFSACRNILGPHVW